jgi:hypothetical protein
MIFIDFSIYFFGTGSPKIDGIGFAHNRFSKPVKSDVLPKFRSIFRKLFDVLNFVFDRFYRFSMKPTKPIRSNFHNYADFLMPALVIASHIR